MLQRLIYRKSHFHLHTAPDQSWKSPFGSTQVSDTQTDTFGNRTGPHLDPIQLKLIKVYCKPRGPVKTSTCGVIYTEH